MACDDEMYMGFSIQAALLEIFRDCTIRDLYMFVLPNPSLKEIPAILLVCKTPTAVSVMKLRL